MRIGHVVCVVALISGVPAKAADWYTGANTNAPQSNFGVAIDASLTGTTKDTLHGGLIGTIAPFSRSDETGMRLRIGGLAGSYKYLSVTPGVGNVTGRETSGSILGGYEWVMPNMTFAVYGGLEVQNRTLSKLDPSNSVVGTSFGFKTSVDFYSNPTSYTMVSGNFTYSTNNNAYYSRLKAGMAVMDRVFVGPEMLFLGDNFYGQWRVGAHITGVKLGAVQVGVSGGYVSDRRNGAGAYGILDTRVQF